MFEIGPVFVRNIYWKLYGRPVGLASELSMALQVLSLMMSESYMEALGLLAVNRLYPDTFPLFVSLLLNYNTLITKDSACTGV